MGRRWNINLPQKRNNGAVLANPIRTTGLGAAEIRRSSIQQTSQSGVLVLIVTPELEILTSLGDPRTRNARLAIGSIHKILTDTRIVDPWIGSNRNTRANESIVGERARSRMPLEIDLVRRIVHHPIVVVREQNGKARLAHEANRSSNQLGNSREHTNNLAGLGGANTTEGAIVAGSTRYGSKLNALGKSVGNIV